MSRTRPDTSSNTTTKMMQTLSDKNKPQPDLPHHPSLSIIGMLFSKKAFEDDRFAKEIAKTVNLARQSKYLKATISLGGARGIVVLNPKDIQEIFEKHYHCLNTKENVPLFNHHFKHSVMSFTTDDPMWRMTRNEIRESVIQLKSNPKKIIALAEKYIEKLRGQSEFNSKEITRAFTAEVVLNGFLDIDTEKLGREKVLALANQIELGIEHAVTLNNIFKLALKAKFPFYQPTLSSEAFLKEGERMLGDIVQDQQDIIWKEGNDNWAKRKAPSFKESNADFVNDLCFLLTAGSETTSKHFEFTLLAAILFPTVRENLLQEIDTLPDPKTWDETTFAKKTPYLDKVILESLRMFPPIRTNKILVDKSFTLSDGTVINAGDHLFLNASATHRLEEAYHNPNEFNPGREEFDGLKLETVISQVNPLKYKFLTFGIGERSCPGSLVATMEVKITLARLFHAYNLSLKKEYDLTDEKNFRTNFGTQLVNVPEIAITPRCRL